MVDLGDLKPFFQLMLYDLYENRLEVEKAPNRYPEKEADGVSIRAVRNRNPEWYRDICRRYPRFRRNRKDKFIDTRVERYRVIGYLERLMEGRRPNALVVDDLIETAKGMQGAYDSEDIEFYVEYGVWPEPFNNQF